MLIVDGHLDLAWNALQWNRNLLLSAYTIRTLEGNTPGKGRAQGTVALPQMRKGRVALSFVTLLARSTGTPEGYIDYGSPAQACAAAWGQLAYYQVLERQGIVRIVTTLEQLEAHTQEWAAWETAGAAGEPPRLGFVISMEGADPILSPDRLEEWHRAGLRLLGLTHFGPGRYAGGTGTEFGLTDLGPGLLAEMERCGVLLDLTHCSDQAFWQALERYRGPVLASHNNCRALVPHQRQFNDEQLRTLIQRDGVIGAVLDAWMLDPGWMSDQSNNENVTLERVVDHIDHVCQLAGNSRHAALGSDLDGGFGREQCPRDLDTIADLQMLEKLLAKRGYTPEDIAAVLHGNWLRLLRRAWRG